ncbi:MAG TPA: saccharopine dehydrogenase C-terminal domain-containing protein [bacterium]|nr:saccharopine dehydrogenase C-terminal domain-containing protein [bacterium]
MLGSGLVARPLVQYLLEKTDAPLVVASNDRQRALELIAEHPRAQAVELDVEADQPLLRRWVEKSAVVVSLLPYVHHPTAARICVEKGVSLVTTSYVSPAMHALHDQAVARGVLLLNEVGLDPGIDHMSAMKTIRAVQEQGGRVLAFESYCGGLPAPEAADNPFRYKFSWSPRGVLLAGRNTARYLRQGRVIEIPAQALFKNPWLKNVVGIGDLEVYPNRDALSYQRLYGLEQAHTVFRGTLRYPGWCETMALFTAAGLLDDSVRPDSARKSWRQMWIEKYELANDASDSRLAAALQVSPAGRLFQNLQWLGLFSSAPVGADSLLDGLTQAMQSKMAYRPGERDMVVLQHDFQVQFGDRTPRRTSARLIDYGVPFGDSSMSRTVGLPAAVAAKWIWLKRIRLTGVRIPIEPEIYLPILNELHRMGIRIVETDGNE